jgi:extracellular elastinolytic metalloproteinase
MSREVDLRRPIEEPDAERLNTLARDISARLPGAQTADVAALDAFTGNAARVESVSATAQPGSHRARALAHLRSVGPLLGLTPTQPAEFVPDPVVQTTSSGARTVHLRQQHQGIPVFQAAQTVVFDPAGAVTSTAGSSVTIEEPLDATPDIRVEDAVLAAARHVAEPTPDELGAYDQFQEPFDPPAVELDTFVPRVTTMIAGAPERTTVLEAGPFAEPITAGLVWFPLSADDIRLGWQITLTMPDHIQRFVVVVDAHDTTILYAHQIALSAAATGNVYLINGGLDRQTINFPRALSDYAIEPPAGLPDGFPDPWLVGADTSGANVVAHPADAGPPVQGKPDGDRLTFDPDPASVDQQVVNLFALASSAHDFFYLLGFTEAEGNFQRDTLGRGGAGTDPVDARVYAERVQGTASMLTPVDGTSPVLRMGPVTRTGRHTALDATVVFHEFTHGVTHRLVGGGMDIHALDEMQSAGMGEGWSDFFACLLVDTNVIASWVVGRSEGIRGNPYDSDYPGDFGQLGVGFYAEVHAVGEVWCATLMEMARRLESNQLAMQLVMDALKLSRANPSFLDMRDAILAALTDMRTAGRLSPDAFTSAEGAIWGAFARFGMGPAASCLGARLAGIHADFTVPEGQAPATPPESGTPEPATSPAYMATVLLDAEGDVRGARVVHVDGGSRAVPEHEPMQADGGREIHYFVDPGAAAVVSDPAPVDLQLNIVHLQFETMQRDPGRPPEAPDRLTGRISFAVSGADAARMATDQAQYLAHVVLTADEPVDTTVLATSVGRLSPQSAGAEETLEFDAPAPGRYQLLGAVIVIPCEVIGVEAGPRLRVMP